MIDNNIFLDKFRSLFETAEASSITMDTHFKELADWESLTVLSLIVLADDEFKVKLLPTEIESSNTVSDLLKILKAKSA